MTRQRITRALCRLALPLGLALGTGCKSSQPVEVASVTQQPPAGPLGSSEDGLHFLPAASRPYVEIQPVAMEPEHAAIKAPARVAFRDGALSRVGAPIPGRVVKLHVEVGEKVKAGDPLVTIASPEASSFHMELARARIEVETAKDQLERQNQMAKQGVGREYERVAAQHRLAETQASLQHAQKAVSLLGKSSGGTVVVEAAIEGMVLRRFATVGAQVEPGGDPLIEIGNPNALWVVAEVFQDDLALVHDSSKVTLEFAALPEPVEGHVEGIGVLIDTGLRRAPVYVAIDGEAPGVTPGMFARAKIQTPSTTGVTVPRTAVLIKEGKISVVYVEEREGVFSRREVATGHTFGEYVQILSGVKPGERIAVSGALLIDGTAQRIL
ncbi:efflux RND transporter periplasmic adaptor subunit [Nannocystis sp. ILAH1]|uniref:efflux RND transporter periplasmic adaptor subunit n=1 Tax=unclassified Nannocystis TaxID=2627009 RepID=UPI00226E102F|nr:MULTISPECIES: efflux RND transporter periplasmic adaptor subunit [unclassified Nannocystis]MCY0986748.1 efflux RND transporter periplasmic adaptor subunit [Nannocystis sp. ILAH1]MCY1071627.1 efflux RND transporter periplasmic adaptor subunit [Nannocystis sp. RBIL2]